MNNFKNKKVCLLTGASGKIGNLLCEQLSKDYNIVGVYNSKHPLWSSQCQSYINPLNPTDSHIANDNPIFAIQADLLNDTQMERVVELTLARFNKIDILINCASVSNEFPMLQSEKFIANLEEQLKINSLLPLKMALHISRVFWKNRSEDNLKVNRHVVNISNSLKSLSAEYLSPLSVSKAALTYLSAVMADEFKTIGIRVNTIISDYNSLDSNQVATVIKELDKSEKTKSFIEI